MALLPTPLNGTREKIFAAYEAEAEDGRRPHLGASLIGRACDRSLYYAHHWAAEKKFSGRMLRLFQTGHLEEPRMIADLQRIGVVVHEVDPQTGRQWNLRAHGNHFGGSMDGCALNIPEAPKTWHVLEFKTSSEKVFKKMVEDGVEKTKPEHFAQMIVYMGLSGMTRALYIMKNKNNDDLHCDRVEFDKAKYDALMAKALAIVTAPTPPLRLSRDPSYFICKFCDYTDICHGTAVPDVSCRTCAHSTAELTGVSADEGQGRWSCGKGEAGNAIPTAFQKVGCASHRFIPIMLEQFATAVDTDGDDVVYAGKTGGFRNGEGVGALSSAEIRACGEKDGLGGIAQFKDEMLEQGLTTTVVA